MWVELSPLTEGRVDRRGQGCSQSEAQHLLGRSGVSGSSPSSATNLLSVLGQLVSRSVLHLQKGWPR